ncbi:MAG: hypothetical protein J0L82_04595 [Deltaproteobacteria bacterium]|nr:hypothetical protein [Deltaproteobacteria bacterium]
MLHRPLLSALLTFAMLFTTSAGSASSSAHRPPGVAAEFFVRAAKGRSRPPANKQLGVGPVVWAKSSFDKAAWNRVPLMLERDLQASFELVRDEKAFTDDSLRKRRATWFYPDDGCFVRATVADDVIAKLLSSANIPTAKIFAFGNLNVRTGNSPAGEVQWWYHVAAITKVTTLTGTTASDEYYVFDPAMNPKAPMPVKTWLNAMDDSDVEIAICAGASYDPDSLCENNDVSTRQSALARAYGEVGQFLASEWERLEDLGRDPNLELGSHPPW